MSKVYFISDAHLGLGPKDEEREKENSLIAFLEYIMRDATQLFIGGDLFDAWIEYRTVIPKGFHRLFTKLEECNTRGITIHYLAGNHDYWMRDFFHDELGIKTYLDAFHITIDGKNIFFHHGDGLAVKDTGYRILKNILRNPFNIWLYSWLHPDLGVPLARSSSQKSRRCTATKDYGEEDGMMKFAAKRIAEGVDIVIMGHRHKPVCKQIGNGLYINLGDWITHNTYAVMENGRIELKKWEQ
jgi:UDP-2,3-diacylglucosamine hydrolase